MTIDLYNACKNGFDSNKLLIGISIWNKFLNETQTLERATAKSMLRYSNEGIPDYDHIIKLNPCYVSMENYAKIIHTDSFITIKIILVKSTNN